MSKAIHKYVIDLREATKPGGQLIETKGLMKPLSIQQQPLQASPQRLNNTVSLWGMVAIGQHANYVEKYRVHAYGTGLPLDDEVPHMQYLGTVQFVDGKLVLHFFLELL